MPVIGVDMVIRVYKVDSFTDKPFSGNPAGVCILDSARTVDWMQGVAREMNLSETAFLTMRSENRFDLRWFTPVEEVRLCGHATLASAHILYQCGDIPKDKQIEFDTLSGLLSAALRDDWIELVFPAIICKQTKVPEGLEEALGVKVKYVGVDDVFLDYLVEVDSEKAVRELNPDIELLKKISTANGRRVMAGVIVTSVSSSKDYDFVSRFFAPALGIDEDPATGSAHCCLGPFWKERLKKSTFNAYQASSRGGIIRVSVENDKVRLGGKAVTIMKGTLDV